MIRTEKIRSSSLREEFRRSNRTSQRRKKLREPLRRRAAEKKTQSIGLGTREEVLFRMKTKCNLLIDIHSNKLRCVCFFCFCSFSSKSESFLFSSIPIFNFKYFPISPSVSASSSWLESFSNSDAIRFFKSGFLTTLFYFFWLVFFCEAAYLGASFAFLWGWFLLLGSGVFCSERSERSLNFLASFFWTVFDFLFFGCSEDKSLSSSLSFFTSLTFFSDFSLSASSTWILIDDSFDISKESDCFFYGDKSLSSPCDWERE